MNGRARSPAETDQVHLIQERKEEKDASGIAVHVKEEQL